MAPSIGREDAYRMQKDDKRRARRARAGVHLPPHRPRGASIQTMRGMRQAQRHSESSSDTDATTEHRRRRRK